MEDEGQTQCSYYTDDNEILILRPVHSLKYICISWNSALKHILGT